MIGNKNTFYGYGERRVENWHTYFRSFQENISFLCHSIENEKNCMDYFKKPFTSLESAKEFIKNELASEQENKPNESVIYHSYP